MRVTGLDVVRDAVELRSRIGLAGQYAAVDENLTGLENLVMVGRLYGERRAAAKRARAGAAGALRPHGRRRPPTKTYSGRHAAPARPRGSARRPPAVLFLDEPTTGLDPRSRLEVWSTIEGLVAEGTTVLLTTQYLEEADRLADAIAVIDRGRVIAEGTPDELKDRVGGERLEVRLAETGAAATAIRALQPMSDEPPSVDEDTVALTVAGATGQSSRRSAGSTRSAWRSTTSGCAARPSTTCSCRSPAMRPRRPTRRGEGGMRRLVSDTLVIAERNLMRLPRAPDLLIAFTVQPMMFVLLFVYVFGGAISTPGYSYVDFLIPGIIVQNIAFGGFVTALGLNEDLHKGLIDRFRSLPMARAAVLAGRTLSDVVTNFLSVVVLIVTGLIIGFSLTPACSRSSAASACSCSSATPSRGSSRCWACSCPRLRRRTRSASSPSSR